MLYRDEKAQRERPTAPHGNLTADPASAADAVEAWMFKMGVPDKQADKGYTDADVEKLVRLTRKTLSLGGLFDLAPVEAAPEAAARSAATRSSPASKETLL